MGNLLPDLRLAPYLGVLTYRSAVSFVDPLSMVAPDIISQPQITMLATAPHAKMLQCMLPFIPGGLLDPLIPHAVVKT